MIGTPLTEAQTAEVRAIKAQLRGSLECLEELRDECVRDVASVVADEDRDGYDVRPYLPGPLGKIADITQKLNAISEARRKLIYWGFAVGMFIGGAGMTLIIRWLAG